MVKKLTGETVYVDDKAISNVLVHIGESGTFNTMNAIDINNFVGPYADYILYFPDTYTDDLTGKNITVRNIECEVIGRPDHERPKSVFEGWLGCWDMTVRVKKVLAEQAERIQIIATVVTRDELGNRTTKRLSMYEGPGQARQENASENEIDAGTNSSISYVFVVDWFDALSNYQTQQLSVIYNDRTYNVQSIENIDEKNQTASIKAVWDG